MMTVLCFTRKKPRIWRPLRSRILASFQTFFSACPGQTFSVTVTDMRAMTDIVRVDKLALEELEPLKYFEVAIW